MLQSCAATLVSLKADGSEKYAGINSKFDSSLITWSKTLAGKSIGFSDRPKIAAAFAAKIK